MSETLARVQALVRHGEVEVSRHGYRELAVDDIVLEQVIASVATAVALEDYPATSKGPSVLALQRDGAGRPVHVVWGIPKGATAPAVLVTAYRPDPKRWSADFTRRMRP
jgi:hypothetical protein